jgi:hypothetical protein
MTGWRTVRTSELHTRQLRGKTMRVISRVHDAAGREHQVVMAQGPYGGCVRIDGRLHVDVLPDPDAPYADDQQAELVRYIHTRRAADAAAGRPPGRELWGPLTVRILLQIREDD